MKRLKPFPPVSARSILVCLSLASIAVLIVGLKIMLDAGVSDALIAVMLIGHIVGLNVTTLFVALCMKPAR